MFVFKASLSRGFLLTASFIFLLILADTSFLIPARHLRKEMPVPKIKETDFLAEKERLLSIVKTDTPREALNELARQARIEPVISSSCHELAHEIGQASQAKYQSFAEAVQYRDELCNSGYLHGVIEAYFVQSSNILTALQAVCPTHNPGSFLGWECYHGVGHGVMFYTNNDLPRAITLCETYEDEASEDSCINGLFMENFNADQNYHSSRYLDPQNPTGICALQKERHKGSCYLYSIGYILKLNGEDYKDAISQCATFPDPYQTACASGLGSQVLRMTMDVDILLDVCRHSSRPLIGYSCASGAGAWYVFHSASLAESHALCDTIRSYAYKSACHYGVTSTERLFNENDPTL